VVGRVAVVLGPLIGWLGTLSVSIQPPLDPPSPAVMSPRKPRVELPNYGCSNGHERVEGRGEKCWFCGAEPTHRSKV